VDHGQPTVPDSDFGVYCDDTKAKVKGVLYHGTFSTVPGVTFEYNLCENSFLEPNEFDFLPVVYYRLTKPLKPKAVLPTIQPEKLFYNMGPSYSFALTASTSLVNYTNKDTLRALVYMGDCKNQMLKEVYQQIINGQFNKDTWRKVEELLIDYPEQEKLRSIEDLFTNKEKDIKNFLTDDKAHLEESLKKIVKAMPFLDHSNYAQVTAILFIMSKYYSYGMKLYEKFSERQVKS